MTSSLPPTAGTADIVLGLSGMGTAANVRPPFAGPPGNAVSVACGSGMATALREAP